MWKNRGICGVIKILYFIVLYDMWHDIDMWEVGDHIEICGDIEICGNVETRREYVNNDIIKWN